MRYLITLALLLGATLSAQKNQGHWLERGIGTRSHSALAADPNGFVLAFGGMHVVKGVSARTADDTVLWDGSHWRVAHPKNRPTARLDHALAYDSRRRETVLFGGQGSSALGDTWIWNGDDWRVGPKGPPATKEPAIAYDSDRQRVVLAGAGQTWEWDGVAWTQQSSGGPALARPTIAYDERRKKMLLVGGRYPGIQVWEWAGSSWSKVSAPPKDFSHTKIAFDRAIGKTVLYAGEDSYGLPTYYSYTYDGTTWTPFSSMGAAGSRRYHAMAYDPWRHKVVVFGGDNGRGTYYSDTWTLSAGLTWRMANDERLPPPTYGMAMAYDVNRNRVQLIGGYDVAWSFYTWEFDGSTWTRHASLAAPFAHPSAAYDSARRRTVLFGEDLRNNKPGTWEFDGANWNQKTPSRSVSARSRHAMAHDSTRKHTILFGGAVGTGSQTVGDTWKWDGTNWTELKPNASPSARCDHAMAYDEKRQRIVLFGGSSGSGETWEWGGSTWDQKKPMSSPLARWDHAMVYDAHRQLVVLFGGIGSAGALADTWTWDGTMWRQESSAPVTRYAHGMAYDRARGQIVRFGGHGKYTFSDAWTYQILPPRPAVMATFGRGCGNPAITLAAAAGSRPAIGTTFTVIARLLPTSSKHAIMSVGSSNTHLGPFLLPMDLSFMGMPGCWLYHNFDLSIGYAVASGVGRFSFPLPNDPQLLDARGFLQTHVVAPSANGAGILSSNGCEVIVGNR